MGVLASLGKLSSVRIQVIHSLIVEDVQGFSMSHTHQKSLSSISGLVVEYIVAIDVTRVRFPADASFRHFPYNETKSVFHQGKSVIKE